MAQRAGSKLRVSLFAPWHVRCGIRDYSAHLLDALQRLPEIASVRIGATPAHGARAGLADLLAHYGEDRNALRRLGRSLGEEADIAHIQHQYFFFGGVAPHKSHIRSFLDAISVPAVMTVHEIAAASGSPLQRLMIDAANRKNFLHPALKGLIVHTEADRGKLIRIGAPGSKVHVVRHGIPPAAPLPDPALARRTLESQYPALHGRKLLTLFGFLAIKKGHRVALDALSRLPEDTALMFAGGQHPDDHTDYVPGLRREVTRRGLEHRVIFTDYLPEERIPEIMAVTDVAIAPFLHSSGSGSLANLLAYGQAIVASDIAPHREIIELDPELLRLFPSGEGERLAAVAEALLHHSEQREQLRQSALAYAARHSYLEMARETVEVYRNILGRQALPHR